MQRLMQGEMIAPFHRFYSFIYKYHPAKSSFFLFVDPFNV